VAGWPVNPLMALGTVLAVVLLAYWVNVANFMDGIDLMEVVGLGLPTLYLSVALLRVAPESAVGWTGVALCGALTGFAGFNWPPARLFLGDSGSLVSGIVSGLVVFETAGRIGLPAALLPMLYFAVDASSTLVWRARRGENLFAAHSNHAYQIARRAAAMPGAVVLRVGVLGVVLCALSHAAALGPAWLGWLWLALGLVLTGLVTLRLRMAPVGNAGQ
jgi:UDP-N-acetylmuramyl pentapeptide phosphotransferase/UDP-N-acetylglucosamine-1-phosphate transferase